MVLRLRLPSSSAEAEACLAGALPFWGFLGTILEDGVCVGRGLN